MKAGIFVADDHYMVIEGIHSLLQHEKTLDWMGHATNAESCHSFLKLHQPEVILMDVNLPDKSGIDLCKEVKQLYPAIAVLGLSTFNQQAIIRNMMDNGASGYGNLAPSLWLISYTLAYCDSLRSLQSFS